MPATKHPEDIRPEEVLVLHSAPEGEPSLRGVVSYERAERHGWPDTLRHAESVVLMEPWGVWTPYDPAAVKTVPAFGRVDPVLTRKDLWEWAAKGRTVILGLPSHPDGLAAFSDGVRPSEARDAVLAQADLLTSSRVVIGLGSKDGATESPSGGPDHWNQEDWDRVEAPFSAWTRRAAKFLSGEAIGLKQHVRLPGGRRVASRFPSWSDEADEHHLRAAPVPKGTPLLKNCRGIIHPGGMASVSLGLLGDLEAGRVLLVGLRALMEDSQARGLKRLVPLIHRSLLLGTEWSDQFGGSSEEVCTVWERLEILVAEDFVNVVAPHLAKPIRRHELGLERILKGKPVPKVAWSDLWALAGRDGTVYPEDLGRPGRLPVSEVNFRKRISEVGKVMNMIARRAGLTPSRKDEPLLRVDGEGAKGPARPYRAKFKVRARGAERLPPESLGSAAREDDFEE